MVMVMLCYRPTTSATATADDDGILSALYTIHKILHFMLPFFGSCLFVADRTKKLNKENTKQAT